MIGEVLWEYGSAEAAGAELSDWDPDQPWRCIKSWFNQHSACTAPNIHPSKHITRRSPKDDDPMWGNAEDEQGIMIF